jgi:hypothetical protein
MIRLTADNYLYWHTQVVPLLWSNLIDGFVDGTLLCLPKENPNPTAPADAMIRLQRIHNF